MYFEDSHQIMKFLKGFFDQIYKIGVVKEIDEESNTPQLVYVPNELIHHIQSLLPAKDAARTCVLSKTWLRAWSTVPTLRFTTCATDDHLTKEEETDYINLIDRTLLRYLNENMSIECLHLHLYMHNSSLSSLAEKWFHSLASRNCLKELSLTICGKQIDLFDYCISNLTIPAEIFSCEKLNTVSLIVDHRHRANPITVNMNLVMIKCLFLRVLELVNVRISSEEALNNLISSCLLLEKINIFFRQDFKCIKVKALCCLRELRIRFAAANIDNIVEINGVPILRVFHYSVIPKYTFKMDSLGSVRELVLLRDVVDDAFINMVNSKFPFLESLSLTIYQCRVENVNLTCDSLTRLTLDLHDNKQINIQVYASKLLCFSYEGLKMPTLLFSINSPEHISLILKFYNSSPLDLSFFINMRKTLSLSSNFEIEIINLPDRLHIDLDDLRREVPSFPARNVQQLLFTQQSCVDNIMWRHSTLFDLFFSICHPHYVKAHYWPFKGFRAIPCTNYLYKQNVRRMMKNERPDLKDVEIKNLQNGKWETLANFQRSYHEEANDYSSDEFKLTWCS